MKPLCLQLSGWRKRLGATQQEAADLLGVGVETYRAWEYGRNEPRGMEKRQLLLQRIAVKPKPKAAQPPRQTK